VTRRPEALVDAFSRLTPSQRRQLAAGIARRIDRRGLVRRALARLLADALRTNLDHEASHLSRFLKGDEAGLRRYLDQGPGRCEQFVAAAARFLDVSREELLGSALRGRVPEAPHPIHPAWPELASVDPSEMFVDELPGVGSLQGLIDRVGHLSEGQALWISGPAGIGKSSLLRHLAANGCGVLIDADGVPPPDGATWLVDDPADPVSWRRRGRDRGARAVIAVRERPGAPTEGGAPDATVTLGPWARTQARRYLGRLDAAIARTDAPRPPTDLWDWLCADDDRMEWFATPRQLGYLARFAAEDPSSLGDPRRAHDVLVGARLEAARHSLSSGDARVVFARFGRRAAAIAAAAAFRTDPPTNLYAGVPRAQLLDALADIAGVSLASVDGRRTLGRLLAQSRAAGPAASKAFRSALELTQSPSADEVLDLLVAGGLWVGRDVLAPAERETGDVLAAEELMASPDGWQLLVLTLPDFSRDGVRTAAARLVRDVPRRIGDLLDEKGGRQIAAIRFATAIAAYADEEATPDQVRTLVASAVCLLGPAEFREANLIVDSVHLTRPLVCALRVVSRRYRATLERLPQDITLDHFARAAATTVRALLDRWCPAGTRSPEECDPRLEGLRRSLVVKLDDATALATLLPWQAPWALLATLRGHVLEDTGTVLLDLAADGDEGMRRIVSGADDSDVGQSAWVRLPPEVRLRALNDFGGPDDRDTHLDRLVSSLETLRESVTPARTVAAVELAHEAIVRWVHRFGDRVIEPDQWVFARRSAHFSDAVRAVWIGGLERAGARGVLSGELAAARARVRREADRCTPRRLPVRQEAWKEFLHHLGDSVRALVDFAAALHRLGTPEPLREMLASAGTSPDEISLTRRAVAGADPDALAVEALAALSSDQAAERLVELRDDVSLGQALALGGDDVVAQRALAALGAVATRDFEARLWAADRFPDTLFIREVLPRIKDDARARSHARRWALDRAQPSRARLAAVTLLRAPRGEREEVEWLFDVDLLSLRLVRDGLDHPEASVQRAAATLLARALRKAGVVDEPDAQTLPGLVDLLAYRDTDGRVRAPGWTYQLTDWVDALRQHERRETADAIYTLALVAQRCPIDEGTGTYDDPTPSISAVEQLIRACAEALHAFGDRRALDLIRAPLGEDPLDDARLGRAKSLRWSVALAIGLKAIRDRATLRLLADGGDFACEAHQRLIEIERPSVNALLREWIEGGKFLFADHPSIALMRFFDAQLAEMKESDPERLGEAGRRFELRAPDRWTAVGSFLAQRAPRRLAAAMFEVALRYPDRAAERSLEIHAQIAQLDPACAAEFLGIVLAMEGDPTGAGRPGGGP